MDSLKKVSIIIPTYNRKEYVQQAIDSVLAQTHTDHEIIVVDDGSTDGTGEALAARYGDKIRYVWQENQGESAARNAGIRLSNGMYVAFLDSDDLWVAEKLSIQIRWLEDHPDAGLLSCRAENIDAGGHSLSVYPADAEAAIVRKGYEELYQSNIVGSPSAVIVPSAVLEKAGGFDDTIRYGEDWDLWLRIAAIADFYYLPQVLVKIRIHAGGQWLFPKPERITPSLQDHLQILEKAYRAWPDREVGNETSCANIRDRTMAKEYVSAALKHYAFGSIQKGHQALSQGLELDPDTWADTEQLEALIIETAFTLAQATPDDVMIGPRSAKKIAKHLAEIVPTLQDDGERAAAQSALMMAYHCSARGHNRQGGSHLIAAIRMNPFFLQDKGIQFVLIKTLLGDTIAQRTRAMIRKRPWAGRSLLVGLLLLIQLIMTTLWPHSLAASSVSWDKPVDLGAGTWATFKRDPVLVCDQYQNVHILWSGGDESETGMSLFYANDVLDTLSPAVDILYNDSSGAYGLAATISDLSDTLHLVWKSHNAQGDLYYSQAPLAGAGDARAWSTPVMLGYGVFSSSIAVGPDGRLHIVHSTTNGDGLDHGVIHLYSDDEGLTWSDSETITEFKTPDPAYVLTSLTIDDTNRIHLGITIRSQEYAEFSQVGYIRSSDGGGAWEPYRLIDDTPSAWQGIQGMAAYSFGPDEVHLTWHDPRRLHIVSRDGGSNWSLPVEIMPIGAAFGGPNELAKDSAGNLFAVIGYSSAVYVVEGDENSWGTGTKIDNRDIDPHYQHMISCQGSTLHVVYRDRTGDQTVWYVRGRVDAPQIARRPIPALMSGVNEIDELSAETEGSRVPEVLSPVMKNSAAPLDQTDYNAGRARSLMTILWMGILSAAFFLLIVIIGSLRSRFR